MEYYVQIDKTNNRVIGISSTKLNIDNEIIVDSNNKELEELFTNPYIFVFNESTNTFTKDIEYQNKLIKEKEARLSDSEKIDYLTKQLATEKLEGMKKDLTMKMLIQQQAQNKLEIMKLKGSN